MKFKRTSFDGYEVYSDGVLLGTVQKWERRYNLRRVYVTKGWRATTPDGTKLYTQDGTTSRTRKGAAEALEEARCSND